MSLDARRRAERCFAVARSTTFPGERAAAINRGESIAKAAGLDLGSFDIPGRVRPAPRLDPIADLFKRARSPFFDGSWTRADFDQVLDNYIRGLEKARRQAEDVEAERARRASIRFDRALNFLWSKGVRVYPWAHRELFVGSGMVELFIAPDESDLEYTREGVLEMATARGFK